MVRRAVLKDWKPPIFGMFFFTRKWSLSNPLLEMFGHIMHGIGMEKPSPTDVLIVDGKVLAPSVPILFGDNKGSSLSIFRKNRLAASRSRLAVSRKSTGLPHAYPSARYR